MCLLYLRYSLGLRPRELAVADNFCESVRLAKDQHLVGTDLDLRSAVLAEDDLVILGDVHGNMLPVFVPGTGTYGEDAAALRLLLCRVGQHDAADGLLLFLEDFHDQAVTKRLQVHPHPSCSDDFVTSTGTLTARVPRDCTVPSARSARGYVPLCYKVGVRREFSAGGVVVRNLRGRPVVAAIRPAGKPEGTWALPKGLIGPGERAEDGGTCPRGRIPLAAGDPVLAPDRALRGPRRRDRDSRRAHPPDRPEHPPGEGRLRLRQQPDAAHLARDRQRDHGLGSRDRHGLPHPPPYALAADEEGRD